MIKKLKTYFDGSNSKNKRMLSFLGIVGFTMFVFAAAYVSKSHNNKTLPPVETKTDPVVMDANLLKQGKLQDARKEAQISKDEMIEAQKREEIARKALADGFPPPPAPLPGQSIATAILPPIVQKAPANGKPQVGGRANAGLPPMPMPMPAPNGNGAQGGNGFPPPPQSSGKESSEISAPVTIESEIGGISIVSNAVVGTKGEGKDDAKKAETRSVYLPVSYMEATLLSGLDAPTSSEGKGNPVPVLIRVKLPAVLPNDVKANLRGCFVVADGKGNLGTERAELTLVNLSCIDRKGQAVIDQPLTGYIVDADGKAGLRGRVVTKMGAIIVRSMMSGMFGGFGEALTASSQTSSLTALGSTTTLDPKNIGAAGLGKGLSGAFKELEKFYMNLASQTLPVIEIGAARPITLVITKGSTLNIMKIKGGNK